MPESINIAFPDGLYTWFIPLADFVRLDGRCVAPGCTCVVFRDSSGEEKSVEIKCSRSAALRAVHAARLALSTVDAGHYDSPRRFLRINDRLWARPRSVMIVAAHETDADACWVHIDHIGPVRINRPAVEVVGDIERDPANG